MWMLQVSPSPAVVLGQAPALGLGATAGCGGRQRDRCATTPGIWTTHVPCAQPHTQLVTWLS